MKILLKLLLFLLAVAVCAFVWARATTAQAPEQSNSEDYISEDITIKDNAIQANHSVLSPSKSASASKTVESYSGRNYSKEEVIELIKSYSGQYGISPDLPLAIARCESGYNQFSKNKNSTASGVFQYIRSTWVHTEAGILGISPFDADANVHMAIKSIASGGISNWAASKSCWNL